MQVREDEMVVGGCFGFARRPFVSAAHVDGYYPAGAIEAARTSLARAIQRGEGAGLVIGPSGTGKTLLCLTLAEQFRRTFQVGILSCGRLSCRRALFQAILYELGRPWRGMDEGELRLAVVDHLCGRAGQPAPEQGTYGRATLTAGDRDASGMLLLVDEAHTLPLRLLDEVRLLTNLARDGQPLVRVVLAGAPVLEERLANPKLDSLSQRLSARCYLEAFNRTETQGYIQSQVDWAGGRGEEVFPEPACQSAFRATGGVPRLINQVCDHALLLVCVAGRRSVAPADVEEAWADLQQLPAPTTAGSTAAADSQAVIEFGALDDADEPGARRRSDSADPPAVFRVASLDEGRETSEAEPARQIHRIERLLAEADDGFQPAGSIGPEVELHFDEMAHPFQDTFEQEEVVVDRYARPKTGVPEQCSREMPCAEAAPPTPAATAVPDECTGPTPCPEASAPTVPATAAPNPWPLTSDPQATAFEPPALGTRAMTVECRAMSPDPKPECSDTATVAPPAPAKPTTYRRLFANLRRG